MEDRVQKAFVHSWLSSMSRSGGQLLVKCWEEYSVAVKKDATIIGHL